jgi:hypothetical protein
LVAKIYENKWEQDIFPDFVLFCFFFNIDVANKEISTNHPIVDLLKTVGRYHDITSMALRHRNRTL